MKGKGLRGRRENKRGRNRAGGNRKEKWEERRKGKEEGRRLRGRIRQEEIGKEERMGKKKER